MPQKTRFTIFDAMEQGGAFSSNPANSGSRDNDGNPLYTAPIEFPRMLYHPDGEEKVVVPAEIVVTPLGPRELNEQREMLHLIVNNKAEFDTAIADGWHDHPAKAMRARIKLIISNNPLSEKQEKALLAKIPQISLSVNREAELLAEIERLMKLQEVESAPAVQKAPVQAPTDPDDDNEA